MALGEKGKMVKIKERCNVRPSPWCHQKETKQNRRWIGCPPVTGSIDATDVICFRLGQQSAKSLTPEEASHLGEPN